MGTPTTRTLTAWLFPTALAADAAELHVKRLEEQRAVTVHDWVSIIWFEGDDEPRTRQRHSSGKAAGKGTLWGVVIGSVLGGPIAGAVVGATAASAGHRLLRGGVSETFVREVRDRIRPGTSALLVLSDALGADEVAAVGGDRPDVTVLRAHVDAAGEGTLAGPAAGAPDPDGTARTTD